MFTGRFLLGKGGIFSARVHPRIKQILRGVKQESNLRREGITRFNKRWRSWAIRQVRLQSMPRPVVLTTDPELMDAEYLATCIHTAACKNLKDSDLWKGYATRLCGILEREPEKISPLHFGYICWGIGKIQLPASKLHALLAQHAPIADMTSHGLSSVLWMLRRALVLPPNTFLSQIANRLETNAVSIRPADFIKICNNLAFFGFGKSDPKFRAAISQAARLKFENETFAQDFREAMDPLALWNLWDDEMRGYILDRFRKIFITARPNHLLKAYYSSVAIRVLAPNVWYEGLDPKTRGFYARLATRHITAPARHMCPFHKSVSERLAEAPFAVPHRNMFRWGPFFIDLGIEQDNSTDDKKLAILLDKKTAFYANDSKKYTEKSKLEHAILAQVGWNVGHVHFRQWKQSKKRQETILRTILGQTNQPAVLPDRTP